MSNLQLNCCLKVHFQKVDQYAGGKWLIERDIPDSRIHGANMGPIWGRQDPGGPHVGPMNFAIWEICYL